MCETSLPHSSYATPLFSQVTIRCLLVVLTLVLLAGVCLKIKIWPKCGCVKKEQEKEDGVDNRRSSVRGRAWNMFVFIYCPYISPSEAFVRLSLSYNRV